MNKPSLLDWNIKNEISAATFGAILLKLYQSEYVPTRAVTILKQFVVYLVQQLPTELAEEPYHNQRPYRTKEPLLPHTAVEWHQPPVRRAAVYTYSFICRICGEAVNVTRRAVCQPTVCDRDDCHKKAIQQDTRERVRRHRAQRNGM
jgi:hypothetical protein